MTFQLTLPTLLGAIIGGVVFVFCLAAAIVIVSLRSKHRKLLAKTNTAGERRRHRYSGGHISITDEDVARIPGTGTAMRGSLSKGFTPIEQQRAAKKSPSTRRTRPEVSSKAALFDEGQSPGMDRQPNPWQVPNRLTRVKRPPMIKIQPSALSSPVTATRGGDTLSNEQLSRGSQKLRQRKETGCNNGLTFTYDSQGVLGPSPDLISFPSPDLRPKPLFHQQSRSVSHGMISSLSNDVNSAGELGLHKTIQSHGGHRMTRSISLTSQKSGPAPTDAMPPLPADAIAVHQRKSIRDSGSKQSLGTGNGATIVWEGNYRRCSRGQTDTVKLAPPSPKDATWKDVDPSNRIILSLEENKQSISVTPPRTSKVRAPLDSHKSSSKRTNGSIPRINSSGLSESLHNHTCSRPESISTIVNDTSDESARSKAHFESNHGSHISVFDFGLPKNLDQSRAAHTQPDLGQFRHKHQSPSLLPVVASNGQGLKAPPNRRISASFASENPHRAKSNHLTNESSIKNGDDAEKRQSFSNMPDETRLASVQTPPRLANLIASEEVRRFRTPLQAQSLRGPRVDPPAFHPPTSSTFDPQFTPTPQGKIPAARSVDPDPYFQTLAKLSGYEDSDSYPNSVISTPTHRPIQKRRLPGTNPNRQRAIFDTPDGIAHWPLARQHPTLSLGLRGTSESPQRASVRLSNTQQLRPSTPTTIKDSDNEKDESRPVSLLFRFPSPPSPTLVSRSRQPRLKSQSQPQFTDLDDHHYQNPFVALLSPGSPLPPPELP